MYLKKSAFMASESGNTVKFRIFGTDLEDRIESDRPLGKAVM